MSATRRVSASSRMSVRYPALLGAALFASVVTACATPGRARVSPNDAATAAAASAASWAATLVAAQRDVERGRHADADRTLREFAERAPGSPEAAGALYWRALIMLDPASRTGSTREASALLERYLASDVPLIHRTEAMVLQRVASAAAAASSRPATSDSEVKALKEELEQTRAELERIRKRLAAPPPSAAPPAQPSTDPK